jgi:predicted peptidase
MTGLIPTLLITLALPGYVDPRIVPHFESLECRDPVAESQGGTFRYRLFIPKPLKEGRQYPLLLWLPGKETIDEENVEQLKHTEFLFRDPDKPWKHPYFVLAPQCPKDRSKEYDVTITVLDDTLRRYPVDPDRVYLLGISAGGSSAWKFALAHPERFAAVAPLGSGGAPPGADVSRLRDVPIWAFHKEGDSCIPIDGVRRTVKAVQEAGGTAHLTVLPGGGHDAWNAGIGTYRVVDWMLWQRRGETC